MLFKRIYVSATNQHVGKTTTTLGLVHTLRQSGINVGYCKPVGQKTITVNQVQADKDAVLFAQFMDFKLEPTIHSPVILGHGAVQEFIDHPEKYNFALRLKKAARMLEQRHDMLIYEGTGHPGVGSVVGMSNADVAHTLGAGVIMVVEAGIGSTIDRLELSMSLFRERNVPIIGVIVNKALVNKMEKVRHYVGQVLEERGIPLLGVMPYEEELGLPLMRTIAKAVDGKVIYHEDQLDHRVRDIIAGSLIDMEQLRRPDNLLLVVSISRLQDALKKLGKASRMADVSTRRLLSGIIVTGKGEIGENSQEYINSHQIPVVHSLMDTYESVIKISKIEVKINTRTPWKISKAVEMFRKHINMGLILGERVMD